MKFYTYILYSESHDKYYIGNTSNLVTRLNNHNIGLSKFTKNKGPWKIVYYEEHHSRPEANRRELEIKKKKSRKYIEYLINMRK